MSPAYVAVAFAQRPSATVAMGPKIVAAYRAIRPESSGRFAYKGQRMGAEVRRIEALPRVPEGDVPRYVAYRAANVQCGDIAFLPKSAPDLFARYPPTVRARWSPEARRLWEEAFYTNRTPAATVEALRRLGQNVEVLEACLIGFHGDPPPLADYPRIVRLLDYAEAHPRDVCAASQAALLTHALTVTALYDKEPIRQDLIRRALALYPRTLRNVNVLLDDHLPSLSVFRVLTDTTRKVGFPTPR